MKIGIVGATGTLGGLLAESFVLAGHSVVALGHSGGTASQTVDVLRDDPDDFLPSLDAVVYCAWATRDRSTAMQTKHAAAAVRWAERSVTHGCTFVFTSTVLASSQSASSYGKHKFQAERGILEHNGVVLRIGLVADDALPLVVTAIRKRCARSRIAARLIDWPVFPIGSHTFASAVAAELLEGRGARVVWLAPNDPTSLALVATWSDPRPSANRLVMRIVSRVAKLRIRRGRIGTVLDGLAGLAHGPGEADPLARQPATGAIAVDSWQECLRPTPT